MGLSLLDIFFRALEGLFGIQNGRETFITGQRYTRVEKLCELRIARKWRGAQNLLLKDDRRKRRMKIL